MDGRMIGWVDGGRRLVKLVARLRKLRRGSLRWTKAENSFSPITRPLRNKNDRQTPRAPLEASLSEGRSIHYNSDICRSDAAHKECENPFSPITRLSRNKEGLQVSRVLRKAFVRPGHQKPHPKVRAPNLSSFAVTP